MVTYYKNETGEHNIVTQQYRVCLYCIIDSDPAQQLFFRCRRKRIS